MEFLLYIVIAAIFGTVIFLAMRSVNEGMKARSELKRDGTLDKNREDQYKFESVTPHEDEVETKISIEKDEQIDAQSVNIMDEIDDFLIVVDQFKNIKPFNDVLIKFDCNQLDNANWQIFTQFPRIIEESGEPNTTFELDIFTIKTKLLDNQVDTLVYSVCK